MVSVGYALSSEEHPASDLVRFAARAEQAGFEYAVISDHFHPWIDAQGQSPAVWPVLGGIAGATSTLRVGTGVTCPTIRYHPVIVAQQAATVATMMPGRFMLGVGTGEALNEHVTGDRFPPYQDRAGMLREAIEVIRALWSGRRVNHRGHHYTVDNARLYSVPDELPPIIVAAKGPKAAQLAGQLGDGLINFVPDPKIVHRYESAAGMGKPKFVQYNVCWAESEAEAKATARRMIPTAGIEGEVTTLLPTPAHFEQLTADTTEEQVAKAIVCGPDPQRHLDGLQACAKAGFDHIHVNQVGLDQEGFFRFYEREVLPRWRAQHD